MNKLYGKIRFEKIAPVIDQIAQDNGGYISRDLMQTIDEIQQLKLNNDFTVEGIIHNNWMISEKPVDYTAKPGQELALEPEIILVLKSKMGDTDARDRLLQIYVINNKPMLYQYFKKNIAERLLITHVDDLYEPAYAAFEKTLKYYFMSQYPFMIMLRKNMHNEIFNQTQNIMANISKDVKYFAIAAIQYANRNNKNANSLTDDELNYVCNQCYTRSIKIKTLRSAINVLTANCVDYDMEMNTIPCTDNINDTESIMDYFDEYIENHIQLGTIQYYVGKLVVAGKNDTEILQILTKTIPDEIPSYSQFVPRIKKKLLNEFQMYYQKCDPEQYAIESRDRIKKQQKQKTA